MKKLIQNQEELEDWELNPNELQTINEETELREVIYGRKGLQ